MAKTERQVTTTNRETELVMVPIEDPRIQTWNKVFLQNNLLGPQGREWVLLFIKIMSVFVKRKINGPQMRYIVALA